MIMGYALAEGRLRPLQDVLAEKDQALWIDLLRPQPEEEKTLEAALGVEVPTREEMNEIEVSSRLYVDGDVVFMTALILSHTDQDDAKISPVTFVLTGSRLLTIRYEEPRVFALFAARAQKAQIGCISSETVLIGLLEAVIDRLADILERAAHDADRLSTEIFAARKQGAPASPDFQRVIALLGRKNDLASMIRDSLVTLNRLFGFFTLYASQKGMDKDLKARLKILARDASSLTDHVSYLSQKITFLLDATLGMINIQQNNIIKLFSVAAVAFLPPTLIASVYGMNFHHMPELDWPFGYPLAVGLMVLSAAVPLLYFRKRGWF
jgi:magnesium transporter